MCDMGCVTDDGCSVIMGCDTKRSSLFGLLFLPREMRREVDWITASMLGDKGFRNLVAWKSVAKQI